MILTAAAGCVASTREKPRIDWVLADAHRVVVRAEIFQDARPVGVKYTDAWQTEEYGLFRDGGRQLEIIYAQASRAFTVALDYQMPIAEMVATWNLNSGRNLVWGPLGRIDSRIGTWFFRNYQHRDLPRSCAGFMLEWDEVFEDPQGRPGKVMFGYFCGAEGEVLEDGATRALIRGIKIGMPGQLSIQGDTADETFGDRDARLFANGGLKNASAPANGYCSSLDTGNSRFPFMFARYYGVSRGGKLP